MHRKSSDLFMSCYQNAVQNSNIKLLIITDPLKLWKHSNIWEHKQQIKITFLIKLRAN
jgi:hypothetical protein